MPTEEFNVAKDRFNNVVDKIVYGETEQKEEPDFFTAILSKLLKFWSDIMLFFFGGKGFSDIFWFK